MDTEEDKGLRIEPDKKGEVVCEQIEILERHPGGGKIVKAAEELRRTVYKRFISSQTVSLMELEAK